MQKAYAAPTLTSVSSIVTYCTSPEHRHGGLEIQEFVNHNDRVGHAKRNDRQLTAATDVWQQ